MLVYSLKRAWLQATLFFALNTFAQLENANWFSLPSQFITFDLNGIKSITGISQLGFESTLADATLSDSLGNLIFYSSRSYTVYKPRNIIMGNLRPFPGVSDYFDSYIFQIPPKKKYLRIASGSARFRVIKETIDTSKAYPVNYDIEEFLEIPLQNSTCIKFGTAIGADNCHGIWLPAIDCLGYVYLAKIDSNYQSIKWQTLDLLTSTVLGTNPRLNNYYELTISNNGKSLAIKNWNYIYVFNFDAVTGIATFYKKFNTNNLEKFSTNTGEGGNKHNIVFSPNAKYLYVLNGNNLAQNHISKPHQLEIETGVATKITDSKTAQGKIAIDGRMYLSTYSRNALSIIHKPDLPCPACDYRENEIDTLQSPVYYFPNTVENYYGRKYDFKISQTCIGDSVLFEGPKMAADDKYIWRFADGFTTTAPGVKRHISQEQKIHLRYNYCDVYDTAWVHPIKPNLTMPTTLVGCRPSVVTINPSFAVNLKQNILWNDNSNLPIKIVTTSGVYVLTISNNCFTEQDSTEVQFYEKPKITQPTTDTTFCEGQQVTITSNYPIYHTNQNNTITTFLGIKIAGNYAITSANACYTTTSSLSLKTDAIPRFLLPNDTLICDATSYNATALANKDAKIIPIWNDGTTENTKTITQAGEYEIVVKNTCGIFKKAFAINFAKSNGGFINTNVFTPNGDEKNDTWQPLTEKAEKYQLQIYNRYGTLVFESTTWNQVWNASNSPDGIYFYHISYLDCNNQTKNIKGTVMVVR